MTTKITHWINNEAFAGSSSATAPVTNPATGAGHRAGGAGHRRGRPRGDRRGRRGVPRVARHLAGQAHPILFKFRELLNERKGELAEIITSEHGKVVSDALGEVSRGQEVVEFACGIPHLLKGGFTENASTKVDVYSIRQPLGVGRRHQPVQLPGDGADVVLPHRHRHRQHRRAQAVGEGPIAVAVDGQAVGRSRPAGRGVQRAAGRQDRRRRTADQPEGQVGVLRRLHPDRPVRLRHRHRARQARPGPRRAPRTTP